MKLRAIFALSSAMIMTLVFALVSGAGLPCDDADSDGICDTDDNCLVVANIPQTDANNDGYGNVCDSDINDDCGIGSFDIGALLANFGQSAPNAADLNDDGGVGSFDIGKLLADFGGTPGPSGKSCATCPTGSGACP